MIAKAAADLNTELDGKLNRKLQGTGFLRKECHDMGDRSYQKPGVDDMVICYLAGYAHTKLTKTHLRNIPGHNTAEPSTAQLKLFSIISTPLN